MDGIKIKTGRMWEFTREFRAATKVPPSEESPPYCPLLELPGEIRNTIYRYILVESNERMHLPDMKKPALFIVWPQLLHEALPIFWAENKFFYALDCHHDKMSNRPDYMIKPISAAWIEETMPLDLPPSHGLQDIEIRVSCASISAIYKKTLGHIRYFPLQHRRGVNQDPKYNLRLCTIDLSAVRLDTIARIHRQVATFTRQNRAMRVTEVEDFAEAIMDVREPSPFDRWIAKLKRTLSR